ncbi:MAG: nucleotidyl transferase AbiEii/AbiGii toxin family protein [candidate division Zixibacteria bacterium]|nr:nucleotidyl transferase AbiEii/AbiGii toxin family protein [candidate division Zixibacteria bacterium]
MKAHLERTIRSARTSLHGRNQTREYLQTRILESLQRSGAMIPLAFHGGTSLRFLYNIPRYSEDLDFALEQDRDRYDFRMYLRQIRSRMEAEGYAVTLKVSDRKVVHSAFIGFPGLLHELGLSPHETESLSVKLEVDTNPPIGAVLTTSVVRRHIALRLHHHDRASLFAGKLHAVLQRPYPKGRDIYDLFWYLSDRTWPVPNLTLLNNALGQTGWQEGPLNDRTWREAVRTRLRSMTWGRIHQDVRPFIESEYELSLLNPETLLGLLDRDLE